MPPPCSRGDLTRGNNSRPRSRWPQTAKGRTLFLPLRQALTGMDHGPDMGEIAPAYRRS